MTSVRNIGLGPSRSKCRGQQCCVLRTGRTRVTPTQSWVLWVFSRRSRSTSLPTLRSCRSLAFICSIKGFQVIVVLCRSIRHILLDSTTAPRSTTAAEMSRETVVKSTVSTYEKLKNEWSKKNRNLDTCGKILSDIKVELTKLKFLPSMGHSVSKEELLVARNTLEIGALWSIANKDIPSFERYIAMLKIYYMDYREQLPESPYMYELLGLDLLCLLAQNKVGEFHTTLEHLPPPAITDNVYIRHPVAMEQYLMEGAYNKIYLAKGEVPAEGYKFFIEELLSTIREDIADCVENAYDRIRPEDIGKMLYLSSTKEILQYCEQRGWQVGSDGYLHFKKEVRKSDDSIPSKELAHQMINYAREMEQIV